MTVSVFQHPLQRLHSPSRGFSALIHVVSLCSFAGSYWYLLNFPSMINEAYGWHWQYLTILGLTGATLTCIFGLLADITLSPKLFHIKNSLALCSAPLEVVISILYWGISAIDRRLVIPPGVELSAIADIGFHLVPSVVLTIDLIFLSPPWKIRAYTAMGLSSTLAFAYWGWVEHCYKHNGWYPYPLFGMLSTLQRTILFALSACIMTSSTLLLKWVYGRVNGLQGEQAPVASGGAKGKRERGANAPSRTQNSNQQSY